MEIDHFVKIIEQVGFPIVVAFYFMVRVDKKLERIIVLLSKTSEHIKEFEHGDR